MRRGCHHAKGARHATPRRAISGERSASSKARELQKLPPTPTRYPQSTPGAVVLQPSVSNSRGSEHILKLHPPPPRLSFKGLNQHNLSRPVKQEREKMRRAVRLTPTARSRHGAQQGPRSRGGPQDPRDPGAHPDQSRQSCPWDLFFFGGGGLSCGAGCAEQGPTSNCVPRLGSARLERFTVEGSRRRQS